jgi:DNA-directed RNA polymerase I subunit RPA2
VIGDKFSSRHGQKGVLSILWPACDMPFTESGLTPDIIINPHAFPSRMTIGMLIESMAGKSSAIHGHFHDGTPFEFHENEKAIDLCAEQLCAAGHQYYGSETVYSGFSGLLLRVEIFVGVVYYQRLRHMVSDKSQVRATGPVHPLTQQPIKGRKRHGGIRLGEMERDALLAHGAAFLLHDRLLESSDRYLAHICSNSRCGSLLASANHSTTNSFTHSLEARVYDHDSSQICFACKNSACASVSMPYVYRYLSNELAGMNVKLCVCVHPWLHAE